MPCMTQDEALNADFGSSTATAAWHSEFRGLLFGGLGATSSLVNLVIGAGGCWRWILQEMTGHFCSQQTLPPVSLLLAKVARQPQLFLKRTAMSLQEGPPVAAEDLRPNCSVHGAMGGWLEVPWQTLKYPCILSILSRRYSIISIFILHAWLAQGSMTSLSPGGVSDLQTCPAVWCGPADLGEWCTRPVHYRAPARGSYFHVKRGGEWRFLKVFAPDFRFIRPRFGDVALHCTHQWSDTQTRPIR